MSESERNATQRRGAKAFAIAIGVGQVCALTRYVVFAHALGPHELGWGVAIVLVGQFFDMMTNSGSDRFLIQHEQGDDPEAQRLVQLVMVMRGVVIALALLLFAQPIANFLGAPRIALGLQLLSLAPLFTGFVHLDWRRVQRRHDFRIEGRATLIAELGSLAVTTVLAVLTHSYLAVAAGLVARALTMAVVTQIMAERRFSIGYSKPFAVDLFHFALPLTITGMLLFFGSQGDRVLIGKLLGPAEVARYSVTMLMMFYPIMVVQRYVSGLYLPQLVRDDPMRRSNAGQLGSVVTIIASLATVGFALVAPIAQPLLFGHAFKQAPMIVALIGALNAARFIKVWPSNMLMSNGQSRGVLYMYLVMLVAIPLTIVGVKLQASLEMIALAFLTGELLSICFGLWMGARLFELSLGFVAERVALFVFAVLVASAASFAMQERSIAWMAAALTGMAALVGVFWWRERPAILFLASIVTPIFRRRTVSQ